MSDEIEYRFLEEWDEDTGNDWKDAGRKKQNKVIRAYNEWQIDGFLEDEKQRLIAIITHGIQTFATRDGGEAWMEELLDMKAFVLEH